MTGQDVYDLLSSYMASRMGRRGQAGTLLAHPTVRRRAGAGALARSGPVAVELAERPVVLWLGGQKRSPRGGLVGLIEGVELLGLVKTPAGMLVFGVGPAFGARFHSHLNGAL